MVTVRDTVLQGGGTVLLAEDSILKIVAVTVKIIIVITIATEIIAVTITVTLVVAIGVVVVNVISLLAEYTTLQEAVIARVLELRVDGLVAIHRVGRAVQSVEGTRLQDEGSRVGATFMVMA